ncbi:MULTISPECIES: SRPBCC family protein [unclassified Microbacterium]|uniref:SRPBCC family protein n=1 Tax=unclassified Microbacterium TaxID=2609290 RepID=UPI003746632E
MSVLLTTTIDIDATPEEVWAVLTDFPAYGQWSNFSRIDGVAELGTTLAMRMPGFNFRSKVTVVTPNEQLQWSAHLFSDRFFLGQHTFTLTVNPDGTTRVTNSEEFSGASVVPFQRLFSGNSEGGYAAFNRGLKSRVEQLAAVRA